MVFSVHPVYSVNAVHVFHRFLLYLGSALLTDGQASTNFKPKNVKQKKNSNDLAFFQERSFFTYLVLDAIFLYLQNNVLQICSGLLCA